MTTLKRKILSLDQKVALIRAIDSGEKKSEVGRQWGLNSSTVATIYKSKDKLLQAAAEGSSSKKMRKPKYVDLDQAMLQWFQQQQQQVNNGPITGLIVRVMAEKFAEQLGITDFRASIGWLGKFKQRHGINYGQKSGQVKDVHKKTTNRWLKKVWPKLKERYAPENIFNADETGIFYKMTPDQASKYKTEKCVGGEMSKERITVLVAANMSGTEKRKLMVIGKSRNPKCFSNMKLCPVTYKANQFAWVTSQLFEEEVQRWDVELMGRKVLLLVDSCLCHTNIPNLWNIELAFFPANTTCVLQPMEQRVIKSLKSHYRKKMLMEIIESNGKNFSLLDSVNILSKAWDEVSPVTIRNSYRLAGLCPSPAEPVPEWGDQTLPLSEWIQQFNTSVAFTPEQLQDFVSVDEELAITEELFDEDRLRVVMNSDQDRSDETAEEPDPPSIQQALDAAKLLEQFFLFNSDDPKALQDMSKVYSRVQAQFWQSKKVPVPESVPNYFKPQNAPNMCYGFNRSGTLLPNYPQ